MEEHPEAPWLKRGLPVRLPHGERVAVIYTTAKGQEVIAEGLREEVRDALRENGYEVMADHNDADTASPAGHRHVAFHVSVPLNDAPEKDVQAAMTTLFSEQANWLPAVEGSHGSAEQQSFETAFPHATASSSGRDTVMALYRNVAATIPQTYRDPEREHVEPGTDEADRLWERAKSDFQPLRELSFGIAFASDTPRKKAVLHLYATEDNPKHLASEQIAAAIIATLQQRFGVEPLGLVYTERSHASDPDVQAGALWITPQDIRVLHTADWLAENQRADVTALAEPNP